MHSVLTPLKRSSLYLAAALLLATVAATVMHAAGITPPLYTYPGHPFTMSGMPSDGSTMPMVQSTATALAIAPETAVSATGWTATASDADPGYPASAVLDGNNATFWHSNFTPTATPLPHWIMIDMKRARTVSRLTYVPRQTGVNGQIGQYKIYTSLDGTTWGNPVTEGTWADAPTTGAKPTQYADFQPVAARYVKLVASTEAGNRGPWSAIAELGVSGSTNNYMAMPRSNWTVAASDSDPSYPATNAIDNSLGTMWHSNFTPTALPLPHSLTIDLHSTTTLHALGYLPRQDGIANGRIGKYQVATSLDGINWTVTQTGAWSDDATEKAALFTPTSARYVKLTALSEAGNRGPWTSAANVSLYDSVTDLPMLPRSNWTATASDQEAQNPANYVLDGNSNTLWHSNYDAPGLPLPHSITIDMQRSQAITGLTYVPRQDVPAQHNGTIGAYAITVSPDNVNWTTVDQNTWADNLGNKTTRFPLSVVRYVKLTALTEAGNRGPWTSASEIYIHGVAPTAATGGSWSDVIGFPLVPTSGAMLPNNKLLVFSAYTNTTYSTTGNAVTKIAILDLNTNLISQPPDVNTNHQMFCTGLAMLADGRLLINGGSSDSATTLYNPFTNTWTPGPLMQIPRAYESTTALSDGRAFTLGGSWNTTLTQKDGEVFTPSGATGTWSTLPGVPERNILTADPAGQYRADNHAWLFASSNGTVFHAGPSKQMNWISTSGTGSIIGAGQRGSSGDAMNGNAVMYDAGKILALGGAAVYQDVGAVFNAQAYRSANTIDISGGYGVTPPVSSAGTMAYQRVFSNSVVLPDGSVLTTGGQQHPQPFTDTAPATTPELWSPLTRTFKTLASESLPRTYHSLALLLPDGRVFSGGGGLCGTCVTNHTDGQIFTPPYLLNADGSLRARPTITNAPSSITKGSYISVTTSGNTPAFSLVRLGSATHAIDTDQRRISLTPTATNGTTYTLPIPNDSGVVLPGYYMLFTLDANGTPSVSKIINVQ